MRRYHDGLVADGVEEYAWDDCWGAYRRGTFAGLVMAVAASMLVERTERGDDMFMAMAHRHARHALDLDAPGALVGSAAGEGMLMGLTRRSFLAGGAALAATGASGSARGGRRWPAAARSSRRPAPTRPSTTSSC